MQCEKCEGPMKETRRVVNHPVMPHWTMAFRMMDCDACGYVTATDDQRDKNAQVFKRSNKSLTVWCM